MKHVREAHLCLTSPTCCSLTYSYLLYVTITTKVPLVSIWIFQGITNFYISLACSDLVFDSTFCEGLSSSESLQGERCKSVASDSVVSQGSGAPR